MSTDPDQIREEIRQTRDDLSADVDALAYKASPSRMLHERTDRVRGAFRGVKERVMGAASDAGDQTGSAAAAISDATSSMGESAGAAAGQVKRAAEGNPLAAGVIVFGAAWLASSLLPKSEREHQAAEAVKTMAQEHAGPVTAALGEAAHDMQEQLRQPAQDAAESVKATVVDAAQTVKDDGARAAQGVRDDATQAREAITR
jgi:hypothetical protein